MRRAVILMKKCGLPLLARVVIAWWITCLPAIAQGAVPAPREVLGHSVGEDYYLANYTQLVAYWRQLAAHSDRIKLVSIGRTTEGRTQYMAIVSSPENLRNLDKYKLISAQLALANGLRNDTARRMAREGKAVVWVDGGLHAAETECSQALIQEVYDLVSSDDAEAQRIRRNVIALFAVANPDGMETVSNWYMRISDPKKREKDLSTLPVLEHPYVGHDLNRDFYLSSQMETTNMDRVLFREWYPQIVHNQHQRSPYGTVVFLPPFSDPFNYNIDPLVLSEQAELGAAMHSRLIADDMPGSTMRSTATYDDWYNGNERTVSYFHNAIGVLSEITGMPTPMTIPLIPENELPRHDLPDPIAPQPWHMWQSVAYSLDYDRALLNYAAVNRERLLFDRHVMGRDAIGRGSRDHWTVTASEVHALELAAGKVKGPKGAPPGLYDRFLRDPKKKDARGYIIAAHQADFPTAIAFLNALIKTGITVDEAIHAFRVDGKSYPAGSYVVMTAQAFRPHVLDMFEPQDHPHERQYPGGPPIPPADAAGYTLAFQMGVKFDRITSAFMGSFEPVGGLIAVPPGRIVGSGEAGFLISHRTNNSFTLTSRLLKANAAVYWLKSAVSSGGIDFQPGAIWVPRSALADAVVKKGVRELGLTAYARAHQPESAVVRLREPRIAIVDLYGGLMPTGWSRWILDRFEIPYTVVYPQRLDKGDLRKDFDVILLNDSAIPNSRSGTGGGMFRGRFDIKQPKPASIPSQYRAWLGTITDSRTIPQLKTFLDQGGSIIGVGSSATGLVHYLKLPVESALTYVKDGKREPLPRTKFYIPGSLLAAKVNPTLPLAYGMDDSVDLFFDSSPVFRATTSSDGVESAVWFAGPDLLKSGWEFGEHYLNDTSAALAMRVGRGEVFLFGPEVALRAQEQGAFKLLFNALFYGSAISSEGKPAPQAVRSDAADKPSGAA